MRNLYGPALTLYTNNLLERNHNFDQIALRCHHISKSVWFYDLRTNKHFTLKTRTLKQGDLQDFIQCYNPENRHERRETERFKFFRYDELLARDKASLDIFWLKDDSLDNLDDLPPPEVLQQEIIEHLQAALAAFRDVAVGLRQ